VPELSGSGYAGATVRNVLDMRTGVRFYETYLDPGSEVRVMERSMGWAPRNHNDPLGMYPYILTTARETDHGGTFTYRSIDTDTLGWIIERACQRRMADLVSERIWQPMGAFHDAEFTVDPLGSAIHDGGVSATLRDLGRFGLMLLDRGMVDGRQIVPAEWIESASYPPADVREAFARSDNEPYLPGGWYRNQFWFVPGDNGPILLCLGIHGQMIFVEAATRTVGVKLSSWPTPQHPEKLVGAISTFRQIARHLS
jgi:CubicO group peptidase (beta-lactamase class C family)